MPTIFPPPWKKILRSAWLIPILGGLAVYLLWMREPVRPGLNPAPRGSLEGVPRTRILFAMGGVPVEITLWGESEGAFREHLRASAEMIEEMESLLSGYRPGSPVSRLNRSPGGTELAPGPVVLDVLREALRIHRMTAGAFDPTVRPLVSLWKRAEESQAIPGSREIAETLTRVGIDRLGLDGERGVVEVPPGGVQLDFGGLGKGYIVDRVVELLRARGVRKGIVNAGGDLRAFGAEPAEPFRIGIRDPHGSPEDWIGTFPLGTGAAATSGNYERFREIQGRRFGHILDPRTGLPVRGTLSVTVRAGTSARADGLATGIFVLGPGRGRELIESLEEVEGILLYEEAGGVRRWVSTGMEGVRWAR